MAVISPIETTGAGTQPTYTQAELINTLDRLQAIDDTNPPPTEDRDIISLTDVNGIV